MPEGRQEKWSFKIGWSAWMGAGYIYFLLYLSDLHRLAPGGSAYLEWMLPLVGVGILFGSILTHELAHAFAFEMAGAPVKRIGLEFWGGYTLAADPGATIWKSASKSFWTSFAGPASNLVVAGVVWFWLPDQPSLEELLLAYRSPESLSALWASIAVVLNAYLAVLNMLPVFPLDGGHVFRAILMAVLGGIVIPTIISGLVSATVGIAGVWFVVRKAMHEGWFEIGDWWFIGIYSVVVLVASLGVLLNLFNADETSGNN